MPGLDVAFLVIVTTSFRLSPVDCTVLICQSVLVTIFKSELSVTHLLALAHLASQSGPAWHVICSGFDNPASGPPPPAQLQAPKRTHTISEFRRTYLIAIPQRRGSPDHGSTPTCAWPGPWRTEIAMEQAFSPPFGSLPPPRSGQRDRNHRMSSGGPMLRTDAPASAAWRCWRRCAGLRRG
jgi:hypothetical protein